MTSNILISLIFIYYYASKTMDKVKGILHLITLVMHILKEIHEFIIPKLLKY